jgi:hypothetical protein
MDGQRCFVSPPDSLFELEGVLDDGEARSRFDRSRSSADVRTKAIAQPMPSIAVASSDSMMSPLAQSVLNQSNICGRFSALIRHWLDETGMWPATVEESYQNHNDEQRHRIFAFLSLPKRVERFTWLGWLVCLDTIFFLLTYLPLRLALMIPRLLLTLRRPSVRDWCDILRASLLLGCVSILFYTDISTCYHWIRVQSPIKLYVMFNMLQVLERMCSTFSEDMMDSLYGSVAHSMSRMLSDSLICFVVTALHSLVHLAQIVTMQVAINSHNNPLITLVISNNFVELKGGLFKKNSRLVVFQISAADVVERFQICIFVFLIVLQQPHSGGEYSQEWISEATWIAGLILILEALVDWVKTGFILSFNRISPTVFAKFERVLCQDLAQPSRSQIALDATHCASRRLGFSSLPLCAVFIRVMLQILWQLPHSDVWKANAVVMAVLFIFVSKAILDACLVSWAARRAPTMVGFHEKANEHED